MLLVTHNNSFHADDVFSAAVLKIIYPESEIVRTRDQKYFDTGDIIFDVGGKYDGEKYFDHHQYGKAGSREDGCPYAAFGLVWKKFGINLCSSQEIVDRVDENLVKYIDALDNGYNPGNISTKASISELFGSYMNPSWNETDVSHDSQFFKSVELAKEILLRKIQKEESHVLSKDNVEKALAASKNGVVILDKYSSWQEFVIPTNNKIIIYPESDGTRWMIRMIPIKEDSFETKVKLKEDWRGKTIDELSSLTGLDDFIFCHADGFIASTKSKESAIKIAELTVNN